MQIIPEYHHFLRSTDQSFIHHGYRFLLHPTKKILIIDCLKLSIWTEHKIFHIHAGRYPHGSNLLPWVPPLNQARPMPRDNLVKPHMGDGHKRFYSCIVYGNLSVHGLFLELLSEVLPHQLGVADERYVVSHSALLVQFQWVLCVLAVEGYLVFCTLDAEEFTETYQVQAVGNVHLLAQYEQDVQLGVC